MSKTGRIFDFLLNYEKNYSKDKMVSGRDSAGNWKSYSTKEFMLQVNNLSKGLITLGLKKGDRIGLMSGNRPEWSIVDFACNQIGIAIVPLYPTLSEDDLLYISKDSDTKMIFASSQELAKRVVNAIQTNHLDIPVYTFNSDTGQKNYSELLEMGATQEIDLNEYRDQVSEEDLLTLIYTSGTTGRPKGVYLTHKNIYSNASTCNYLINEKWNISLSFLPLSHIFERMVVYMYYSKGLSIYFSENLDNVVKDINEIKPYMFTTVPRVLEKVYDKIIDKGKELTGIKKSLFFWAVNLGLKYQEPGKNSAWYNVKLGIARKLIFKKWQEALGGNIKMIVSGGAALQERLARIFWAADIKVLEGYGLTETSPVIAVNTYYDDGVKFGTVGHPIKNVQVKIASDGEILVKGPSVFEKYLKNEEATKEAFDEEGYFRTGDIGIITPDGFLKINDRKKEIFKTAGGKYVAPQIIENKLMESTLIGQIMVVGENRKFPSALIVPNFEELEKWMNHKGMDTSKGKEELIQDPLIIEKYQSEIDRLSKSFGHWEIVKKFRLLPEEWTINKGQLTPKLSLKRKVILQEFEKEIEKIYEN